MLCEHLSHGMDGERRATALLVWGFGGWGVIQFLALVAVVADYCQPGSYQWWMASYRGYINFFFNAISLIHLIGSLVALFWLRTKRDGDMVYGAFAVVSIFYYFGLLINITLGQILDIFLLNASEVPFRMSYAILIMVSMTWPAIIWGIVICPCCCLSSTVGAPVLPAGRESIGKLFVGIVRQTSDVTPQDLTATCPICLENFKEGETVVAPGCCHRFHPDCLETWVLRRHGDCPYCRQPIVLGFRDRENQVEAELVPPKLEV